MPPVKIVGQKKLELRSGEIYSDLILVPLFNGGTAEGMQVLLTQKGKTFHVVAYGAKYGKRFSEATFIKFLNEWKTPTFTQGWSSTLSPQQKSMAYTKRGEWLRKSIVRRPDALADFQKAVQLDSNNSEARLQFQSLMNELASRRETVD